MRMSTTRLFVAIFVSSCSLSTLAQAQSPPATSQPTSPAAAQPADAPSQQLLKAEQLDQLLAPIALYPDTLLAEVLMASTYPLEVVEADRWVTQNKSLKGDELKAAADKQSWDDSLKSLVATPSVLSMMSTKLDWTQKLGDAVLAQQPDVMDAVQRLRAKAQAQNKLQTTKEQKVSVRQEQSRQVIVIEPAEPNTVYVPYYDPAVVYGTWPYAAYPPYYFPAPGYIAGAAIATGIAFGAGVAVGAWATRGNYWGGGVNWGGNNINVNRPININNTNISGNNWQHNSVHRHGVQYNNADVRQRYGNNNIRAGNQERMDFRGRSGNEVLRPDGNRPNAGGDRPNVADRGPGNRPDIGDRKPGAGADRPAANRPAAKRPAADRPAASRPQRDNAFANIDRGGGAARAQADRGRASLGGGGGGRGAAMAHPGGGGRPQMGGGGRGGGGAMRGGGGGGRRR